MTLAGPARLKPGRWTGRWMLGMLCLGGALHGHPAAANCVLMTLGGGMSLMSCSDGTRGTAIELGNGLASYRLTAGASGMLNLRGASTHAAPPGPPGSSGGSGLPGETTSSSAPATASGLGVASGGSLVFLVSGDNGLPKAVPAAAGHAQTGGAALTAGLTPKLTPAMTNLAESALVPMSGRSFPQGGGAKTGSAARGTAGAP